MNDIIYAGAGQLAARLRQGDLSAVEVLEAHLDRIAAVNGEVNAICTLDEEGAMEQAIGLDQRSSREVPGPLHGLPIAIKDLINTRGLRTTYGSPLFRDHIPDQDDLFVERLRRAGAVIIGKTNTSEFGAGSQTFNSVFGTTRNPYDLSRTVGGSSGGAAAALASGMLPIADGSDLGGSLRNPAAFCNLVGFRPSPGRVPRYPVVNLMDGLRVLGPMGRSVEDVALLLSVMAGPDARDPLSLDEPGTSFANLPESDWQGTRVALAPDLGYLPLDDQIRQKIDGTATVFEDLGCIVEEAAPDLTGAERIFLHLRARDFGAAFGGILRRQPEMLKDTIRWNTQVGLELSKEQEAQAETDRAALYYRTTAFFSRYDFLVCAATQVPPFSADLDWVRSIQGYQFDNYLQWMQVCCAISLTAMPGISVPCGFTADGLPVGVQLVAGFRQDRSLLAFARAFERATGHAQRRPAMTGSPISVPDR